MTGLMPACARLASLGRAFFLACLLGLALAAPALCAPASPETPESYYLDQIASVENRQGAVALELRRNRAYPWERKAQTLAAAGKNADAAIALETYAATDPDALLVRYKAMIAAQGAGNKADTVKLSDELLARIPGLGIALFYRATAEAGDPSATGAKAALADFRAAAASADWPLAPEDRKRALMSAFEAAIVLRDREAAQAVLGDIKAATGRDDPARAARIAALAEITGDATGAAKLYRQQADATRDPAAKAALLRKSGYAWQKAGDTASALKAFMAAFRLAPQDHASLAASLALARALPVASDRVKIAQALQAMALSNDDRTAIAMLLIDSGDCAKAESILRPLVETRPTPEPLLMLGMCEQSAGKTGPALDYLETAQRQADALAPARRHILYASLGYIYAEMARYADAEEAWRQAQSLPAPDGMDDARSLSLKRATMLGAMGRRADALRLLAGLDPGALGTREARAEYAEELAGNLAATGDLPRAIAAARKAAEYAPSADRFFALAGLLRQGGDLAGAHAALVDADLMRPHNAVILATLGYVEEAQRDYASAARRFEAVAAADPDLLQANEDAVYAHARAGENQSAERAIRRAVDSWPLHEMALAEQDDSARVADLASLFALRRENQEISREWSASAFTNPCFGASSCARLFTDGDRVSEGAGGAELAWRPPGGLGYDDGRVFEVFVRAFWSDETSSVAPLAATATLGTGARYKPFGQENLFLSVEELWPLGSGGGGGGSTDTLMRISYSTNFSSGDELLAAGAPFADWTPYRTIYLDADQYAPSPVETALYGSGRLGLTTPLGERERLSPYVFLDGYATWQSPLDEQVATAGIGASFRFFFDEDKYTAPRGALEIAPSIGHDLYESGGKTGMRYMLSVSTSF